MKAKGLNFANFSQINICNTQVSNKVKFYGLLRIYDLYQVDDSPIGGSFWEKDSLLQYTMTLLQGPQFPVLPTLNNVHPLMYFFYLKE